MKRKGAVRFTRKILNATTSPFQISRFSASLPALRSLAPPVPFSTLSGTHRFQRSVLYDLVARRPPIPPLNPRIPQNRYRTTRRAKKILNTFLLLSRLSIWIHYPLHRRLFQTLPFPIATNRDTLIPLSGDICN